MKAIAMVLALVLIVYSVSFAAEEKTSVAGDTVRVVVIDSVEYYEALATESSLMVSIAR